MTRALLVLADDAIRERAIELITRAPMNTRVEFKAPRRTLDQNAKLWAELITRAPMNTRVEFKAPRRTLDQNAKLWAMLTDISAQKTHCGRKYTADQWKAIMLHACGREVQFIPSLSGEGFIPWGQSSSDLSKAEMSELIEFMLAWGTQNGIAFHDGERRGLS